MQQFYTKFHQTRSPLGNVSIRQHQLPKKKNNKYNMSERTCNSQINNTFKLAKAIPIKHIFMQE